jgi:hypothetical protein
MVNAIDKVKQINQILESKGIASSWKVRTEREALGFVVDVLETESVLGNEKWDEAVKEFSGYVLSYTSFMDELADKHLRYYGDCE